MSLPDVGNTYQKASKSYFWYFSYKKHKLLQLAMQPNCLMLSLQQFMLGQMVCFIHSSIFSS